MKRFYVIASTLAGFLLPYVVSFLSDYGCSLDGILTAMVMCGFVGLTTSLIGLRLAS